MSTIPDPDIVRADVSRAIAEDLGSGDVTAVLVAPETRASATVIAREAAVLCGRDWFDEVFRQIDKDISIHWLVADGEALIADKTVCTLSGNARALLSGERCALNFLQTLSGTATLVQQYAARLADSRCRVLDTRKTIPGLRHAQKYAVHCGGGSNHRIGLFDAILIKENHLLAAGGIAAAVAQARAAHPDLPLEVEVETLAEVRQALHAGADRLLLDNFTLRDLGEAVRIARAQGNTELEASGNVTLETLSAIAASGVDFISVGALTKHLQAIDLSMRFNHS